MDQAEALRSLVAKRGTAGRRLRLIAVTSGKGGVGKTSLTVNLGVALAQRGKRVGLLDADFGLANLDIMFGMTPRYTLADALFYGRTLDEIAVMGPSGLRVYPGGSGLFEMANLSEERLRQVVSIMSSLEESLDILLIDTAAGVGEEVLTLLESAHELIVVTTPEPTAITDAYAVVKRMSARRPGDLAYLVVNRVTHESDAERVRDNLNGVLARFVRSPIRLELLGSLPVDQGIPRAIVQQVPYLLTQPRTLLARNVYSMADRLLGEGPKASWGIRMFIRSLARIRR